MSDLTDIRFPRAGIDLSEEPSMQDRDTTRRAVNVRVRNPRTRRRQGGSRAGSLKFCPAKLDAIGSTKVAALGQVMYDNQRVNYAALSPAPTDLPWSRTMNQAFDCYNVQTDRQANVIAFTGAAAIQKLNRDNAEVWTLALPALSPDQVCRALAIDDQDNVFVGVTEGGTLENARIWRVRESATGTPAVRWEIETGAHVAAFALFAGKLYTVQNKGDRFLAEVVVYDSINSVRPREVQRFETAYPAVDIAVKADGSILTASPPFANRGKDPRFPGFTQRTVDWTPLKLTDASTRIWSWYKASSLIDQGLEEGDSVTFWPDISGNERHLYKEPSLPAPILNARGIAGIPTVSFGGATNAGSALTTLPNQSIADNAADQQKSIIPAYVGARWVMVAVIRIPEEAGAARPVFSWDSTAAGADAAEKHLMQNRASNAAVTNVAGATSGVLSWHEGAVLPQFPGAGAGGLPIEAAFNQVYTAANATAATGLGSGLLGTSNGVVIISIGCDGSNATVDPAFHSFLRINGKPFDRWRSAAASSGLSVSRLGMSFIGALTNLMQGELAELIVLRDYPAIAPANDVVLTHPKYPRTVGTVGGAGTSLANNWAASGDSELERIEGYLAHEHRSSHLLPAGIVGTNVPVTGTNPNYITFAPTVTPPALVPNIGHFPHPFYQPFGPPRESGVATESQPFLLHSTAGVLAKFSPTGAVVWVATNHPTVTWSGGAFAAVELGGIGHGVRVNPDGNIYSTGPIFDASSNEKAAVVRMIVDKGATYSTAALDGAWSRRIPDFLATAVVDSLDNSQVKMAVDSFGNLFLPILELNTTMTASLAAMSKTGAMLFNYAPGVNVFEISAFVNVQQGLAVAVDPRTPIYGTGGLTRCEFVYLATDRGRTTGGGPVAGAATLFKVPLVQVTSRQGSPRTFVNYGWAGGNFRKFTTAGVTAPAGAGTMAQPELATGAARYVTVDAFGLSFSTDGVRSVVYDPVTDTVKPWVSNTAGALPSRFQLLDLWRGRMIAARLADKPHALVGSRVGFPFDWNTRPPVITPTQAFDVEETADAGRCPDIITGLCPYDDDLLVVFCDHTIWLMTGDPMEAGRWDNVSTKMGGAFGRAWTRDSDDNIWFLNNDAELCVWRPGVKPQPVNPAGIGAVLATINFETHYVELAWNQAHNGVMIFQFPYAHAGFAQVDHWFYELNTGDLLPGALFTDRYGSPTAHGVQPTAVTLIDGDRPGDRRVLLGREDGYIGVITDAATSDDGLPIATNVLVNVPSLARRGREVVLGGMQGVLASDEGGCHVNVYAAESPDVLGEPVWTGKLNPGRNELERFGARGAHVFIELASTSATSRWSLDSLGVLIAGGGPTRRRR